MTPAIIDVEAVVTTVALSVAPPDAKLITYAAKTGLEKASTETLVEAFRPIFAKSRSAIDAAKGVAESVKDATCVTEIRKSRACRLAIRAVRLESDATRKKHKEHALLYGRAVDGFHNILMADLSPVETALQEAEDTAERAEAARKASLKSAREAELKPFLDGPDAPFLTDLSTLTEKAFTELVEFYKLGRQAKLDAAAKVEAEAKAKAEADRIERERIAAEVARLKAEAIAREAAAKAEREAAEKKLAGERAAAQAAAKVAADKTAKERAAIEAKAKAERDAFVAKASALADKAAKEAAILIAALAAKVKVEQEAKAKADADKTAADIAAKKAAAAPDAAKVMAFAKQVRALGVPLLADHKRRDAIGERLVEFADWIEEQAVEL